MTQAKVLQDFGPEVKLSLTTAPVAVVRRIQSRATRLKFQALQPRVSAHLVRQAPGLPTTLENDRKSWMTLTGTMLTATSPYLTVINSSPMARELALTQSIENPRKSRELMVGRPKVAAIKLSAEK